MVKLLTSQPKLSTTLKLLSLSLHSYFDSHEPDHVTIETSNRTSNNEGQQIA